MEAFRVMQAAIPEESRGEAVDEAISRLFDYLTQTGDR